MQSSGTNESDFPHTYREFVEKFYSNDACAAYLEELRWPTGFSCPICQAVGAPWRQTRGRLVCTACRHQTSVTTGTIMDKTRTPLTTWFEAAWHLTTAKNGLSAKTLSYLEEFTFRFNRRTSNSRGLVFRRLMEQALITGPITEADVTFGYDWSRHQTRRS